MTEIKGKWIAGPFKVMVVADSSGKFASNNLEFTTLALAEQYAVNLAARWPLVLAWAVVPASFEGVELDEVKAVCLSSDVISSRMLA